MLNVAPGKKIDMISVKWRGKFWHVSFDGVYIFGIFGVWMGEVRYFMGDSSLIKD